MSPALDRRSFVLLAAAGAAHPPALAASALDSRPSAAAPAGFPRQDPALVEAVVGASHSDLDRVRDLVDRRPALARASWDWGFGDWESALGAASHTGRREIAEYLIAHGARPNLFTMAMLGDVDSVRAAIEASPGIEAIHGPHGITLMAHARAGREAASRVVDYLDGLGTADPVQRNEPLEGDARTAFVGTFAYGTSQTERLHVELDAARDQLRLIPEGASARFLFHKGSGVFHPAGVPSVSVRFERDRTGVRTLLVEDGGEVLRAERTAL